MSVKNDDGYIVSLIGILISVCLLVLLYLSWLQRPVSNSDVQPLTASGTVPTTKYEAYRADIDAAKKVQGIVSENGTEIQDKLGE
jgi:hypothetical protein